ncbi:DUF3618 domain-containing protein [Miniimonas arenae]|uniref:DUF3618 domain-containing protein n=1 Tax=Miniimonas arenae TaxID=676201 RepID=A0A5C5BAK5_9MICO|nr:DUF3618 domain-containing protein [Miniimonas arenae]TNU73217.1 DUF3618 domain-containing protein [Miniimonas arenae]
MSTPTDDEKPRKRSAAEIQAELEATRADLGRTVDQLADRVDPRAHAQAAKEKVVTTVSEQAEQAKEKANALVEDVKGRSTAVVDDVKAGNPRTIAIVGGAVAAVVAAIVLSARRGR